MLFSGECWNRSSRLQHDKKAFKIREVIYQTDNLLSLEFFRLLLVVDQHHLIQNVNLTKTGIRIKLFYYCNKSYSELKYETFLKIKNTCLKSKIILITKKLELKNFN